VIRNFSARQPELSRPHRMASEALVVRLSGSPIKGIPYCGGVAVDTEGSAP